MRILIPVHQYLPRRQAGTEVYAHALARELARRHEVLVYCHEALLDGGYLPALIEDYDGVRVRRVAAYLGPRQPPLWQMFCMNYANARIEADFARVLDEFAPHIVHAQHLKDLSAGLIGLAAQRGVPVVMTLHDYWALCSNAQCVRPNGTICERTHWRWECGACAAQRLPSPALRWAAPLMAPLFLERDLALRPQMRRVQRFIAPSAFLRARYIAAGYPAERIVQIENGLDLATFAGVDLGHREAWRGHYAFIGSLAWQKGVHVLVEAFRQLGDVGARLKVWGDPGDFPDYVRGLHGLANECPWISFEGRLEHAQLGQALAWADYLVVPSLWWENSPVTIQEAYAAHVPVIASDLGAMREKVKDGTSGLLFAPGKASDLARVLGRTCSEPELLGRLRAGLPAVQSIAEHVPQIERIYRNVLP